VEAAGIEPGSVTALSANTLGQSPDSLGTNSGTFGAPSAPIDAGLRAVALAWPHLTEATRRDILSIIREASNAAAGQPGPP
jgi:hypothetical protein